MIALIFDTETNGLIDNLITAREKQPDIIEFFGQVVNLETGEKLSELEQLIKPPKPIDAEITNITGINDEMVSQSPAFEQVAGQIEKYITTAPLVIAHNLSYDKDMLNIEFQRLGHFIAWPPGLCTVEQSVHYKGYRLNLTSLHEYLFGQPFVGAHRARPDVEALTRCCVEMFKRRDL
jgi:DNA polymerase III epsilon subunit family exonuclease